jgi:hypothetical protein
MKLKPPNSASETMPKGKIGRPSSYKPEYAEQSRKLALLGLTDAQVSIFFDVSESTLNLWKLRHKEFSEAYKRGKVQADAEVAHSLFNRARGCTVKEQVITSYKGKVTITEIEKHYPPDVKACRHWLTNRAPRLWRDKVIVENNHSLDFETMEFIKTSFEDGMRKSRERQAALKLERGLLK